jgi:hypothetical protein
VDSFSPRLFVLFVNLSANMRWYFEQEGAKIKIEVIFVDV